MAATAVAAAASLFEALDKDGDGKVSASELRGCAAAALDEEEAAAVVAAADADGDGLLCRDEFLGLAREAAAAADQQADDDADGSRRRCLRVAFGMFADDGATAEGQEQCITPASLQRMLARLVVGANKQQQQLALDLDECRAMICRCTSFSPLIPPPSRRAVDPDSRLERARAHRHRTRPSTEQRRPPHSPVAPPGHAPTPPILPGRVADSPPVTIQPLQIRHGARLLAELFPAAHPKAVSWDRLLAWLARHSGTLTWYQTVSSIFGSGLGLSSASCEEQL